MSNAITPTHASSSSTSFSVLTPYGNPQRRLDFTFTTPSPNVKKRSRKSMESRTSSITGEGDNDGDFEPPRTPTTNELITPLLGNTNGHETNSRFRLPSLLYSNDDSNNDQASLSLLLSPLPSPFVNHLSNGNNNNSLPLRPHPTNFRPTLNIDALLSSPRSPFSPVSLPYFSSMFSPMGFSPSRSISSPSPSPANITGGDPVHLTTPKYNFMTLPTPSNMSLALPSPVSSFHHSMSVYSNHQAHSNSIINSTSMSTLPVPSPTAFLKLPPNSLPPSSPTVSPSLSLPASASSSNTSSSTSSTSEISNNNSTTKKSNLGVPPSSKYSTPNISTVNPHKMTMSAPPNINLSQSLSYNMPLFAYPINTTPSTPLTMPSAPTSPKPCNCKKSKCLKLYCECFARGESCKGCNCVGCENTDQDAHRDVRERAVRMTIEKDSLAFFRARNSAMNAAVAAAAAASTAGGLMRMGQPILPNSNMPIALSLPVGQPIVTHPKGCHCKKSGCLKKYCECYQTGVPCSGLCKCTNCQNGRPCTDEDHGAALDEPVSSKKKKKKEVAAASSFASPIIIENNSNPIVASDTSKSTSSITTTSSASSTPPAINSKESSISSLYSSASSSPLPPPSPTRKRSSIFTFEVSKENLDKTNSETDQVDSVGDPTDFVATENSQSIKAEKVTH